MGGGSPSAGPEVGHVSTEDRVGGEEGEICLGLHREERATLYRPEQSRLLEGDTEFRIHSTV